LEELVILKFCPDLDTLIAGTLKKVAKGDNNGYNSKAQILK
tara:strand:+ start:275 stop:397 length:123 start_codon:yes stop_codon:yes gene_type:complete